MAEATIAPPKSTIWKKVLYAFFLLGVLVCSTFAGWIFKSNLLMNFVQDRILNTPPEQVFGSDSINILVLGCDENISWTKKGKFKSNKNTRSDMMLVAHLDFKTNEITGLSIPRDLQMSMPGYSSQKINGFHAIGGTELSKEAVENLLGIRIDRVAKINYDTFQEIVNILGGVEVFVGRDMKYTDNAAGLFIDLKKGRQKLNGYDAMCYVRYRKGDSDYKRQERQKDFMLAMKESMKKNPFVISEVSNKLRELTGNAFTDRELAKLMNYAVEVGGDNIRMSMIPIIEPEGDPLYRVYLDEGKIEGTLEEFNFKPKTHSTSTTDSDEDSEKL